MYELFFRAHMKELPANLRLFKALGDETRLRLLLILKDAELNVTEMVRLLGVHQSNISRHLLNLREAQLVMDRKEGTVSWYRWSSELKKSRELIHILESAFLVLPDIQDLLREVELVIEERKQQGRKFFDQIAGRYKDLAKAGGGMEPLLEGLLSLQSWDTVADLGCGEGDLTLLMARVSKKVYAVDLSPAMLQVLEQKAMSIGASAIEIQVGDIEHLPLESESVDLAIMSQSLHHASKPHLAVQEMSRVLKKNGSFLILDLLPHDQEWMRERMGDVWLGLPEEDVLNWLQRCGLKVLTSRQILPEQGLPVLLISGNKI